MSFRTLPKRKLRKQFKTVLIYTEGSEDQIFLQHIKNLYYSKGRYVFKITLGTGGSADSIVYKASRVAGAFDKKFVVIDNDKDSKEMKLARESAKQLDIALIEHTPCLEGVLLSILKGKTRFTTSTSKFCKKVFESEYISSKNRRVLKEYSKVFPKELLDEKYKKVKELKKLISLFCKI